MSVHDLTEQHRARERLQLVNEASVRIGTTLDVTRTAEELADVCVPRWPTSSASTCWTRTSTAVSPPLVEPPVGLRRTAHRSITEGRSQAVAETGQLDVYPAGSPRPSVCSPGR